MNGIARRSLLGLLAVPLLVLAGCSSNTSAAGGSSSESAAGSSSAASASASASASGGTLATSSGAGGDVTIVAHDSFSIDPQVLASFEASSGIKLTVLSQGDAGALTNKLVLTKDNPIGDVMFGVDNTFASRALDAGILQPYTSPLAADGSDKFSIGTDNRLTAIDYGDVCVNVDHQYFADHNLPEPVTYEDLAKPEYKGLLVTESAATSSPGLAFLIGTIDHFGDDKWQNYWKSLQSNGLKVDSGWEDAYTVDFSGSSGKGSYPLVVSYASSPPAEVQPGATQAPTSALLNTCFRQVEYAGVLTGAKNPAGAQKVVDFLLSKEFQATVAPVMYVYPVDAGVPVPDDWQKFAPVSPNPAEPDPNKIAANRDAWVSAWSDIVGG